MNGQTNFNDSIFSALLSAFSPGALGIPGAVVTSTATLLTATQQIQTPIDTIMQTIAATSIDQRPLLLTQSGTSAGVPLVLTSTGPSTTRPDRVFGVFWEIDVAQNATQPQFTVTVAGTLMGGAAFSTAIEVGNLRADNSGRIKVAGFVFPFIIFNGMANFVPLATNAQLLLPADPPAVPATNAPVVTTFTGLTTGNVAQARLMTRGEPMYDMLASAAIARNLVQAANVARMVQ